MSDIQVVSLYLRLSMTLKDRERKVYPVTEVVQVPYMWNSCYGWNEERLEILESKVQQAIKDVKGKAAGSDGVTPDML